MTYALPNPNSPTNGDAGNADPIRQNFQSLAQAIQNFDGSQVQAASIQEAALANNINPRLRDSEILSNSFFYVTSPAAAWTAAGGLVGTRVFATAYIMGYRTPISAIGSKTFPASSDNYVSVDYLGNVTSTPTTNGGTPPSLPANSIWDAIVVTDASSITMIHDLRTFSPDMLARTVLGGNTNTILLPNIPAKANLRVAARWLNNGGAANLGIRFNNDTTTICPFRFSTSGGADSTNATLAYVASGTGTSGFWSMRNMEIDNIATSHKLVYDREVHSRGTGTTQTDRIELSASWPNTTNQITRMDGINFGAGTLGTGSGITVFGSD